MGSLLRPESRGRAIRAHPNFFYVPPLLTWLAGSSRTSAELTTEDIAQTVSVQDEEVKMAARMA